MYSYCKIYLLAPHWLESMSFPLWSDLPLWITLKFNNMILLKGNGEHRSWPYSHCHPQMLFRSHQSDFKVPLPGCPLSAPLPPYCPTCSCQRHRPQAPHRLHDLPTQKTSNVSSLVTEWLSKPCSPSVLYVWLLTSSLESERTANWRMF